MTPKTQSKINQLINSIESKDFKTQNISAVLRSFHINYSNLKDHFTFNHSPYESYGRSVLYNSSKLEIVLMSWEKDDFTSIHDHGHAQWGAVLCFGKLIHTSFEIIANNLTISNQEILQDGEIKSVSEQLIHQMGNPFNERALSLHIYGTEEKVIEVTGEAKNYDPVNQKIIYANGGAFLEIQKHNVVRMEAFQILQDDIFHKAVRILLNHQLKRKQFQSPENKNVHSHNKSQLI